MKKIFGLKKKKKDKPPPMTVEETTERINRRGDIADEKIKNLEMELLSFKEQIKKARPGAAQDALKARALRVLKQKKMYEAQRDMLYNQSFKLERVSFATEGIKDSQQTMAAMKAGNKDLEATLKMLKIDDVDKLQDQITNIVDESNEIQDSLVQGHSAADHLDEDDLVGELDALEDDVKTQKRMHTVAPSEAAPEDLQSECGADQLELRLPSAPGRLSSTVPPATPQIDGEPEIPAPAPRSSIRT